MAISLKYTNFHKESTNTEEGKKQLSAAVAGSVAPGVGTLIGAVIGFIIGCVGSDKCLLESAD